MLRPRTRLVGLAALLFLGCSSGASSSSSSSALSAEACVARWWTDAATGPCSACSASQNPECGQSDCVQIGFIGFASGQATEGILTVSQKAGTASTLTKVVRRSFKVVDNRVQIEGSKGQPLVCTSDKLKDALSYQVPASTSLAAALDRGLANGSTTFTGIAASR